MQWVPETVAAVMLDRKIEKNIYIFNNQTAQIEDSYLNLTFLPCNLPNNVRRYARVLLTGEGWDNRV